MKTLIITLSFIFLTGIFSLSFASAYRMPSRGNDLVGHVFTIRVRGGDSVNTIRARYEISYHEILEANPHINFRRLRAGQTVIIPAQYILPRYRRGLVLNMPELRIYYFSPNGRYVYTFPVGMGKPNWRTPTVITSVYRKVPDPTWHVPKSIQAYTLRKYGRLLPNSIPPGPKNPLGKYALYLTKRGYLIHGTNAPNTVGTFASSGCMRLASHAIELLYEDVGVGTRVYIIHHANKAGWSGRYLYLESHIPVRHGKSPTYLNKMAVDDAIENALEFRSARIDWNKVRAVTRNKDGIPHVIGTAV